MAEWALAKRPPCGPEAGELRNKPRARRIRPAVAVVRADGLPVASVFVVQTNLLQTDGGEQVTMVFCSDQLQASCAWGAPVVPAGLEKGAARDSAVKS